VCGVCVQALWVMCVGLCVSLVVFGRGLLGVGPGNGEDAEATRVVGIVLP
jgi:hypothetical protein